MDNKKYNNVNELQNSFASEKTYLGSEIKSRILNSFILNIGENKPTKIKKYDIIVLPCGKKNRPCVVIKIIGEKVIAIPLTSGVNVNSLVPYDDRFSRDGYLCLNYEICHISVALESWRGVFEDKKSVLKTINLIKQFTSKF